MTKKPSSPNLGNAKHTGKNEYHTTESKHQARVSRAVAGDKNAYAALIREAAQSGPRTPPPATGGHARPLFTEDEEQGAG